MQPASVVGEDIRSWLEQLASTAPAGCFVELGVFQGGTAWHLARTARKQGRELYLYDTFRGMPFSNPELGDQHKEGDFSDTSLEAVQAAIPDAICVPGVFPESLVEMPPVAFIHLDCDQYQSYRDGIEELFFKRAVPNAIMVFDDYPFLPGATRAVEERFGQLPAPSPQRKVFVTK